MRNVSAGIIIFFVVIMLGSIIWFEAFHLSKDNKYSEVDSSEYEITKKSYQSKFVNVDGSVQMKSEESEDWKLVTTGEEFMKSGEIMTLGDSKAILSFENGIIFRLGMESKIKLEINEKESLVYLELGELLVKADMSGSQYTLSLGKYKTRGDDSVFYVNKDSGRYKLVILEGEVNILNESNEIVERVNVGEKIEINESILEKKKVSGDDFNNFIYWGFGKNKSQEIIESLNNIEEEIEVGLEPVN